MSLRFQVYCAFAAAFLLAAMFGAWLLGDVVTLAPRLVVQDGRTGRVILSQAVVPGARFTLSSVHAVSRGRVAHVFEVGANGALIARVAGGDGGLAAAGPRSSSEAGDLVIRERGLGRRLSAVTVFVHPHTEHRLKLGAQTLDLSGSLPAGTQVRIAVKRP